MHFSFSYNKKKVLQALRYHFIAQKEIQVLFIVVLLFDVVSAVFYFTGKIKPEPFLLGAVIWFCFLIAFWYFMPNAVYKRSQTFREKFTIYFQPLYVALENDKGRVEWQWNKFVNYFETPYFFHLYFSTKSFFLLPKDAISKEDQQQIRSLLNEHVKRRK